jgi:hypothetical protein
MAQAAQFVISEFTNPSGEIVFRVTGWLDGNRIRKNFPTRAEASAERQALEIQRLQVVTGIREAPSPQARRPLRNELAWFVKLHADFAA